MGPSLVLSTDPSVGPWRFHKSLYGGYTNLSYPETCHQVTPQISDRNSLNSAFPNTPLLCLTSRPACRPLFPSSQDPTNQHLTGSKVCLFFRNSALPMAISSHLCLFKTKLLQKVYYLLTYPLPSLCLLVCRRSDLHLYPCTRTIPTQDCQIQATSLITHFISS